jgi:hypothetical protein
MNRLTRRTFLQGTSAAVAGALTYGSTAFAAAPAEGMKFALCTYLWGRDWDLPTLLANCEKTQVLGVELRTEHAHGVGPKLNAAQRAEVRKRFADSPVKCVGLGSNECYDSPDPNRLKKSIEDTKAFLQLSHDVGSAGVKVKPNSFQKDVPHEKTIEQIGRSLNEIGAFAAGLGQEVRLEVHGSCAELPTIKAIMDIATHKSVGVCWNCNGEDLRGAGLEANFKMVCGRFGQTAHVRELDDKSYPYPQLIELFVKSAYQGWILLEARTNPADRVAALAQQRALFLDLVAKAQKR